MPIAMVYTLRPQRAARVPAGLGRAAHALVLEQIAVANPALAERLHIANELRPLTVSNPLGLAGAGPEVAVQPNRRYRLRVTLLTEETERLGRAWLVAPPEEVFLGGLPWSVESLTARGSDDSWAGREDYGQMVEEGLRRAGGGPGRWTLEFSSPVSFRQRGMCQPMPSSELVFGSLLDRWNTLAPLPLPGEVRRYAAESLIVSRFDLRTEVELSKGGVPQVGAVGRCSYIALEHDPVMSGCIEALTRFAFFGGVGAGTARGLGQARAISSGTRAPVRSRSLPVVA